MTTGERLIAVAGEALVDLVLEPDGTTVQHLGGGSYNTARTIGRLGLAAMEPEQPALQTARDWLERGPAVVLLTHGSRGATVITAAAEAAVPAPPANIVDTIGAGDAFGGGWLAGWVAGGLDRADLGEFDALVRTTRFAAQVAARTCEHAGAEPPYALRLDDEWCVAAPVQRSNRTARAADEVG